MAQFRLRPKYRNLVDRPQGLIPNQFPSHLENIQLKHVHLNFKQQTYDIRIVNDDLYINTAAQLSLTRPTLNKEQGTQSNEAKSEPIASSPIDEEAKTLSYWAVKILRTPDPKEKADLTDLVARKWLNNELEALGRTEPPEQPERLENLNVVDPAKIRRGKGGTLASRIALLHSLANIEQWAIDLSWDIISRFANTKLSDQTSLPKQFFTDFIKVACDEAKVFHSNKFLILNQMNESQVRLLTAL